MRVSLSNLIEPEGEMEVSEVTGIEKGKSFREIFCVEEVPESEYPKVCYRGDPLMVIPGQCVEGKGLQHKLKQCLIVIQKKHECFVFQQNNFFVDKKFQPLDEECMLVFHGKAKRAFILVPDKDGAGQTLYRLEDDVEIGVYLETELDHGKNGYYVCLIKDTACGINLCSVTADSRSAEFMVHYFVHFFG